MSWLSEIVHGFSGSTASDSAKDTNAANIEQAREQMKFQERMSNTAYQRSVEDMRAAGINPIWNAGGSGASTPSGAAARLENPDAGRASALASGISSAANVASTAMSIPSALASIGLTNRQSSAISAQTEGVKLDNQVKTLGALKAAMEGGVLSSMSPGDRTTYLNNLNSSLLAESYRSTADVDLLGAQKGSHEASAVHSYSSANLTNDQRAKLKTEIDGLKISNKRAGQLQSYLENNPELLPFVLLGGNSTAAVLEFLAEQLFPDNPSRPHYDNSSRQNPNPTKLPNPEDYTGYGSTGD